MVSSRAWKLKMGVRSSRDAARAAGRSSPSALRGSGIAELPKSGWDFPKSARILRSQDYRRVYDQGAKFWSPLFSAFCLRNNEEKGVRIGFTCPRALGGSVIRNRIKRRVREAARTRLARVAAGWEIVINPRGKARTAPFAQIESEIERLFERCAN
jgi:ribonuclease P protein component